MRVLHMLHPLEVKPGDNASTVRLGFKWVSAGDERELVLCVCSDRCTDPDLCGLETAQTVFDQDLFRSSPGRGAFDDLWSCGNCWATGMGDVSGIWVGQFYDIPARLIADEHEIASRTYPGLLASMRRAYGEVFSESDHVTVLSYRRTA